MARDANTCVTLFFTYVTRITFWPTLPNCKRNARLSRRAFSLPIFQGYNSIRLNLARSDPSVTMNYCDWSLFAFILESVNYEIVLLLIWSLWSVDFSDFRVPFRFLRLTTLYLNRLSHRLKFHFSVILSRKNASSVTLVLYLMLLIKL